MLGSLGTYCILLDEVFFLYCLLVAHATPRVPAPCKGVRCGGTNVTSTRDGWHETVDKIRAIIPMVGDMTPWYWHLRGPVAPVVPWKYLMYTVLLTHYILFGPPGILILLPGDLGTLKATQLPEISGQGKHFEIAAAGVAAAFVPTWSQADLVFRDW